MTIDQGADMERYQGIVELSPDGIGASADGRVYLKREEECVAACCGAPVVDRKSVV